MNNTKYPRTYHFPFSEGATFDDKTAKEYVFLENTEVVITEKLDGGNITMTKSEIFARSHSSPTTNPWDKEVINIHKNLKHKLSEDEWIFGEGMEAIHSLHYKALESHYYMFGVRVKDEMLSWDDVCEYAYILDLPTAPVLFRGSSDDIKTLVLDKVKEPSVLDAYCTKNGNPMMEGIVCRKVGGFHTDKFSENALKWVRANHVNSDSHWTRNWLRQKLKYEYDIKKDN